MRCSNCGTENRPEVRFCRKCGYPLAVTPASAPPAPDGTPPSVVCPACGATVKAGGRFCPRCGAALDASTPKVASPPSSPAERASVEAAGNAALRSEPAVVPDYGLMPVPAPATRTPQTLWIVLGGLIFLGCVVLALVTMATWLRQGRLPFVGGAEQATITPAAMDTPDAPLQTALPNPTITPPALPPVLLPTSTLDAPLPIATLTQTLSLPTPTLTATVPITPSGLSDARVVLTASAQAVRIGEPVLFTVTLVNTGEVALGRMRYSLEGSWDDLLVASEAVGPLVIEQAGLLEPGAEQTVVFRLEGRRVGIARVWAGVTFEVQESSPYLDRRTSSEIVIGIAF
ncbi:MAG: zinc ribbon domain-containing protein [Anaerolineae bacterium]|nr:zinc ribbon domain-containing protein [Anaerolineae bacterium]